MYLYHHHHQFDALSQLITDVVTMLLGLNYFARELTVELRGDTLVRPCRPVPYRSSKRSWMILALVTFHPTHPWITDQNEREAKSIGARNISVEGGIGGKRPPQDEGRGHFIVISHLLDAPSASVRSPVHLLSTTLLTTDDSVRD